jgi:cell wall-associated NlpC family hydrolase
MIQTAVRGLSRLALALGVVLAVAAGSAALSTPQARAAALSAPRVTTSTLGDRVLNKAETKAGSWYSYGSAGPAYFDCSGLVYWAAGQLGISLPRTTFGMLAGSAHLYRIPLSSIRRGDLVFYGSGHVEINTAWYHMSFGAHHSGTTVGWQGWNGWYAPTMAMRFR